MSMKWSTAYLKNNAIYLTSDVGSDSGSSKRSGPFFRIELPQSTEAIGEALLEALANSKMNVPLDPDWVTRLKPLVKLASAKSWRDFLKGTKSVHIREIGQETFDFLPTENDGRGGFDHLPEIVVTAEREVARVVGEALLRAFNESR